MNTTFEIGTVTMITCRYSYVRLDGSMGIKKRQKIVDRFNNPSVSIDIRGRLETLILNVSVQMSDLCLQN